MEHIHLKPPETMIAGWRELVRLPGLETRAFRAKLDTGARTSALHASNIRKVEKDGRQLVAFEIDRPRVKGDVERVVEIADHRLVTSSNGEEEMRFVIETGLMIGALHFPIELTLTKRGDMRYPMLIGRQALAGRILINPTHGYLQGTPPRTPLTQVQSDKDN